MYWQTGLKYIRVNVALISKSMIQRMKIVLNHFDQSLCEPIGEGQGCGDFLVTLCHYSDDTDVGWLIVFFLRTFEIFARFRKIRSLIKNHSWFRYVRAQISKARIFIKPLAGANRPRYIHLKERIKD